MNRDPARSQSSGRLAIHWTAVAGFLLVSIAAAGAVPRIEFTTTVAEGRGVHPVRLVVDTTGPARNEALSLEVPPGARWVIPPPATVAAGAGAREAHMLHLLILPEAPAGELVLRGALGASPLETRIPVRGRPDFRVLGAPAGALIAPTSADIPVSLVVRNRGNTPLRFRVSSSGGDDGPRVSMRPESFALDAGAEREVSLVIRAPERSRVTTEQWIAVQFEGSGDGFSRIDPVLVKTLFVAERVDPGPLFAQLEGNIDTGLHSEDGREEFATLLRLSGEIAQGVRLQVHALDGDQSLLGSQLDLAGRDTWRVSLEAPSWHATAGEARAPSLGFLAPGVFGRGGVAGVKRSDFSADVFALRDSFSGLMREAAGVKIAGTEDTWEAGAIWQRSEQPGVSEERAGAFGGLHWKWRGVEGRSEVAVAGDRGASAAIGLSQWFGYKTGRTIIDVRLEHAGDGFFLRDQSSERQSFLGEFKVGAGWTLTTGAENSDQTGRLRTLLEERDNSGAPDDPPEVIELINEVATRQRSYRAGLRREFAAGTFQTALKRQERVGELDTVQKFTENVIESVWTSRSGDRWWRLGMTTGREEGGGDPATFAEMNGAIYWNVNSWSRLEGSVRWTTALSGEPVGFRREGVYGQLTASATPARNWRVEARVEGYDFSEFEPRTRVSALVRFPIGRSRWSGALEWGRDLQSGDQSAWVVVRTPLSIRMPWRPIRGTVSGRVVDSATGRGLSSVLISSGNDRAMTDASGRYQLPAMEPGSRAIDVQTPAGWTRTEGTPRNIEVIPGRKDTLDIALTELGTLRGEVIVIDSKGNPQAAPAGVLVAEGADGRVHETLVFRGVFTMRLPPGTYRAKFVSELPEAVGSQLTAEVTIGGNEPVSIRLEARQKARGIRKTLLPGGGK